MFTRESVRIAFGLLLALTAEAIGWGLNEGHPITIGLALSAIGLVGVPTLRKGLWSLLNRRLNIHLLMTVAVLGAIVLGHWGEAAVVITLYALAELLEERAIERSERTLQALLNLHPPTATMLLPTGEWQSVSVEQVPLGARLRVAPGERIPLDGTVAEGTSTVDQSPITGESVPVEKQAGAPVYAGTLNQYGALEITVTAEAGNTKLDQIAHTVQEAHAQKTRAERWIDRFAQVYTPILFGLAILVALLLPPIAKVPYSEGVYRALVLLVLGCPCALVISVPVTILSALTASARRGILVRGGRVIEQCAQIKQVLFDKTGTLTLGKPQLVKVVSLDGQPEAAHHQIASSLAQHSEHPLAQALRANSLPVLAVSDFQALPGMGMTALVEGRQVWVGNHRLIEQQGRCSKVLEEVLESLEAQGYTVVVLFDSQPRAVFALQDLPRASARSAGERLRAIGVSVGLLTGDNATTANAIALQVGIDEVYAEQLPGEKQAVVMQALRKWGSVAMVGDGINDAPALAVATVGISIAHGGTDLARETADCILMRDDLRLVPQLIGLARQAMGIVRTNIAFVLGVRALFFALALMGQTTLWMAILADMGVTLLVVANGLRMVRQKGVEGV